MQRVKCEVRLSGDVGNTVLKENVTPAEIVILNALHGEGSVVNVQPTSMCKTAHSVERGRLSTTYGHHVVDRLFPGEFTKLPVTLAAIAGEGGDDEEEDESNVKPGETDEAAAKREADRLRKAIKRAEEKRVDVLAAVIASTTVEELLSIAKNNKLDIDGEEETVENLKEALGVLLAPAE